MTETLNGWQPPLIYDIAIGEKRIATQEDVDRLMEIANFYNGLRMAIRREIEAANARVGLPGMYPWPDR